jgi:hemerythrin superfamily protein
MSIVDRVIAAVTLVESESLRAEARDRARAAASPGDWLWQVLEQHLYLEAAFAAVKSAQNSTTRRAAEKILGIVLTGHAIAEEAVLYPAMALTGDRSHATTGYSEQTAVKIHMAALEQLPPMSQDYLEKLEQIRGALTHHMYEEEGTWFLNLRRNATQAEQDKMTQRYREEFSRYAGEEELAA